MAQACSALGGAGHHPCTSLFAASAAMRSPVCMLLLLLASCVSGAGLPDFVVPSLERHEAAPSALSAGNSLRERGPFVCTVQGA